MLLGTKKLAFLGLLLALTEILAVFGSVFEMSTFFFLAAASFLVGAAIVETGIRAGSAFYLASVLLAFFLVPDKMHVLTLAVLSLYILIIEIIRKKLSEADQKKVTSIHLPVNTFSTASKKLWGIKLIVFNVIYLPALIFFPKLIYPNEISAPLFAGLIAAGQVGFIIYDLAYDCFIVRYWGRIRKHLPF